MPQAAQIRELEQWLTVRPNDRQAIRQLVTALEFAPSGMTPVGPYSAAQAQLAALRGADWHEDLLVPDRLAERYVEWMRILSAHGLHHAVPIGQIFSGRVLTINGTFAQCGAWLAFFKDTGVIPALCHDCYKVQILPHDLNAMFQTLGLLLKLDLPGDNARKCMIELREGIDAPYKGYVYCEGPDEARACLQAFRALQAVSGVTGVSSKISHGCSEYGQKYPEFKFSDDESAPVFEPPPEWPEIERRHFRNARTSAPARRFHTRPTLSLRDVFGFCTWVRYAGLIGDPASAAFGPVRGPGFPPAFGNRVRGQAADRARQMKALQPPTG